MTSITTVLGVEDFTLPTGNSIMALSTATSGSASAIAIKRLRLAQFGSTTPAMIRGEIALRAGAGTLTTTAATPTTIKPDGAVSGFTGSTAVLSGTGRSGFVTTDSGAGGYASILPFNFLNVAGYLFKPAPDEQIVALGGLVIVVRLLSTPASTADWCVTLWLEEMGEVA